MFQEIEELRDVEGGAFLECAGPEVGHDIYDRFDIPGIAIRIVDLRTELGSFWITHVKGFRGVWLWASKEFRPKLRLFNDLRRHSAKTPDE
jgi:hypothetical protein